MELCPEKPGRVECARRLIEGECDAIACLAFAGLAAARDPGGGVMSPRRRCRPPTHKPSRLPTDIARSTLAHRHSPGGPDVPKRTRR